VDLKYIYNNILKYVPVIGTLRYNKNVGSSIFTAVYD